MTERNWNVFFLIYDNVEVLDFTGPFDVFSMTNVALSLGGTPHTPFTLRTVAPTQDIVTAIHGLRIVPDHGIADCPIEDIDLLIVPGGMPEDILDFAEKHPEVLDWIIKAHQNTQITASVCIGALLLAQANARPAGGFLDGLKMTTHAGYIKTLEKLLPKTTVIPGARYVDNFGAGCATDHPVIAASAGVSAGLDLSFHLLRHLLGPEAATKTQQRMEYNSTLDFVYDGLQFS